MDEMIPERFHIESHKGPYEVIYGDPFDKRMHQDIKIIVDKKVSDLYNIDGDLIIESTEQNKTLERMPYYVDQLLKKGIKRNDTIVAIGGGITQDISCFIAATLMRGVEWIFYPTTLLAQCDSCIGSKSSINCGDIKNIVGTFTPAVEVVICTDYLDTLSDVEIRSGIGEMLKVHAISGQFDDIARDYDGIVDGSKILEYIHRSLMIKKSFIEEDEFDRGKRNILNYGHTFGHAIESATEFAIPHGIAISIGMDMANFISHKLGYPNKTFELMHDVLKFNYFGFNDVNIDVDKFIRCISKDKKNIGNNIAAIIPDANGILSRIYITNDVKFISWCNEYLDKVWANV